MASSPAPVSPNPGSHKNLARNKLNLAKMLLKSTLNLEKCLAKLVVKSALKVGGKGGGCETISRLVIEILFRLLTLVVKVNKLYLRTIQIENLNKNLL